jgi:hypothetical protein
VRNLHPAYCLLLVNFDAMKVSHERLEETLRAYFARLDNVGFAYRLPGRGADRSFLWYDFAGVRDASGPRKG